MEPDDSSLIRILEGFMLEGPAKQTGSTVTTIGPVSTRLTQIPSPVTNMAGLKLPTEKLSDETILEVRKFYEDRGAPFGWLVGPNSPADLAPRLQSLGFSPFEEFSGLVMKGFSGHTREPDSVTVEEVDISKRETFAETFAAAFGLPMSAVSFMCDYFFFPPHRRARNYLAYLPEEAIPIAAATTVYYEADGAVVLAGAAVAPTYRRRGVYTALLQRRLADASRDDMKAAVIQAVRSTSAPICMAHGFTSLFSQTIYAWPDDDNEPR